MNSELDIKRRLDRIEKKLDVHLEQTMINKADIKWIRGFIKISVSAFIAIVAAILHMVLRIHN